MFNPPRFPFLSFPPLTNFHSLLHFYLSAYWAALCVKLFNTFPFSSLRPLSLVCPHLSLQDNRCGCPERIIHEGTPTYSWGNTAHVNFKLSDLVPTSLFSTPFRFLYWKMPALVFHHHLTFIISAAVLHKQIRKPGDLFELQSSPIQTRPLLQILLRWRR